MTSHNDHRTVGKVGGVLPNYGCSDDLGNESEQATGVPTHVDAMQVPAPSVIAEEPETGDEPECQRRDHAKSLDDQGTEDERDQPGALQSGTVSNCIAECGSREEKWAEQDPDEHRYHDHWSNDDPSRQPMVE
jgi:hypothetical protein